MKNLFLSVALLASFSAFAEVEIKLMTEDNDSYPFNMKDKSGIDFMLLDMAAKKVGVKLSYTLVPWDRCLSTMQAGETDGCFPASFKEKRMEQGEYPMSGAKADDSKRLHNSSFSLFVASADASKFTVSGYEVAGFDKAGMTVCATQGYSIVDDLKKAGYKVDDTSNKADALYKKLLAGRCNAVAAITEEGDAFIAKPEFAGKLARVQPPMVEKAYYLMFSKKFATANAEIVKKFYAAVAEIRESAEYKKAVAAYLSK